MLFGAGILLFIGRLEKREAGMMPAEYFSEDNYGSCYSAFLMHTSCCGSGIFISLCGYWNDDVCLSEAIDNTCLLLPCLCVITTCPRKRRSVP
jgi:hypothetical protein